MMVDLHTVLTSCLRISRLVLCDCQPRAQKLKDLCPLVASYAYIVYDFPTVSYCPSCLPLVLLLDSCPLVDSCCGCLPIGRQTDSVPSESCIRRLVTSVAFSMRMMKLSCRGRGRKKTRKRKRTKRRKKAKTRKTRTLQHCVIAWLVHQVVPASSFWALCLFFAIPSWIGMSGAFSNKLSFFLSEPAVFLQRTKRTRRTRRAKKTRRESMKMMIQHLNELESPNKSFKAACLWKKKMHSPESVALCLCGVVGRDLLVKVSISRAIEDKPIYRVPKDSVWIAVTQ